MQQRDPSRRLPGPVFSGPVVSMRNWRCHTVLGCDGRVILPCAIYVGGQALWSNELTDIDESDPYEFVLGTS